MIGTVADYKRQEPHHFHSVGHKYIRAVVDAMDAVPVLFPALAENSHLKHWLSRIDGLLLTGAYSNIEPHHYDGPDCEVSGENDPERDATALPLIKAALQLKTPVFGICRGFQEINVALGGTLHQSVHREKNLMDHREDKSLPLDAQYAPVHLVKLERDGYLYEAVQKPTIMVNSLHKQGVKRLADSLQIECVASDGLVEGFSLRDRERFVLGVQWHPEWQVMTNPDYQKIFDCFARACWRHKKEHPDNPVV